MKSYDRGSGLFWLAFSLLIFMESLRLGIGIPRRPGVGLLAFGASGLLGILSLILFVRTFFKKEHTGKKPFVSGPRWKRIPVVLAALLIYSAFMPVVGYLISTFLLMSFLFWILWIVREQKWWWVFVSAFLVTIISYYVFSVWLNCQFPSGFLGL